MSTQEQGTALSQKVADAAKSISNIPGIEEPVAFIEDRLAKLGIYGEEDHEILTSSDCTEGDARCVFCEGEPPVLPVPRFKRVWRILKAGAENPEEKSLEDLLGGSGAGAGGHTLLPVDMPRQFRPHGQWKDSELLEAYGPDCDVEIFSVLGTRSHGRAFIVFEDGNDNVVDVESTLKVLRLARRQETPDTFLTDRGVRKLYPVGVFPSIYQTECPLHPGTLLFGDYCEDCKASWEGLTYKQLQFARIVMENDEGPIDRPKEIRAFIQQLRENAYPEPLEGDYPCSVPQFMKSPEEKPNLRKKISSHSSVKDPVFGNKKKY